MAYSPNLNTQAKYNNLQPLNKQSTDFSRSFSKYDM